MRNLIVVSLLAAGAVLAAQTPAAVPRAVHLTLHEGTNMAAALSPDGRTIAMDLLGTLWTMPAQGGAARAITDIFLDARQPSWSPDSRRLAFQAYRHSTWQIWTVNADGTDLKPVTSSPFDDREPVWAPDGARLAFSSDRGGSYDIWTLTLATGEVRRITTASSNEFMPSWRSATDVAYVSDRRDAPGLYAAPAAGKGGEDVLVQAADGALAAPAFGPAGGVAFNAITGSRSRLMVGERNIADADEDVFPFRPQWLPDGDLLYTADGKIKRRLAAGGAARVIEFSADVSFTRPAFTPKRHAFDVAGAQPVRGIMHPAIFNRTRVYGAKMIRDLPRREDIYLGIASSKHAMAIAGIDSARPGSDPIKYRVVNSWGPDIGDHGIYHMYAEWFEENVFKLAIHQSVLDRRDRAAYDDPEPVPGGNFY